MVSLIISGCVSHSKSSDGIPDDVKESIRVRVDEGHNVGIIVGLVSPSGTEYFSYGSGSISSDQRIDENTVLEIGSITKVFTAILLADMAERGEVSLDDPIEKYLPDAVAVSPFNNQSITLAHLATHTSGLPRLPDNLDPVDPYNPFADYSVERMYGFLSEYMLPRDIGAELEYSNLGYGLLGHILEIRSGKTYEQLIHQTITEELGMLDTAITLSPEMQSRLASGHSENSKFPNWDFQAIAGAGALRSTAKDLLTFLAANMGLMESRLFSAMQATHAPRNEMDVGLAWLTRSDGEKEIVWHNGGTGGYRSFIGFVEDDQRGVVVLTNSDQSVDELGFHLLDPTIPLREFQEHTQIELDRSVLERFVGEYRSDVFGVIEISLINRQMWANIPGETIYAIYAESGTDFFFKRIEAQITFGKDDDGRVVSLTLHRWGFDIPAVKLE